jgi:hypothetical protein
MSTKSRRLEVSKADLHNERSEMALGPQSVSSPLADFAVAANGRSDGPHRSILRW